MPHQDHLQSGNLIKFKFAGFFREGSSARLLRASGRPNLPWLVKYATICVAIIVAFIVLFRHDLGLDSIDYYASPIGGFAIFGIVGVIGLSVALMAATFYSDRSGIDDEVGNARDVGESHSRNRADDQPGRGAPFKVISLNVTSEKTGDTRPRQAR